jgi:hypothetical protein
MAKEGWSGGGNGKGCEGNNVKQGRKEGRCRKKERCRKEGRKEVVVGHTM